MFIDINEIEGEGISFDRRLDLSSLTGSGADMLRVKRARIAGRAEREDVGVILSARLDAIVEFACSRCTEPFEIELDVPFRLTLVPLAAELEEGETSIEDEDTSLFSAPGGKADLAQIAAEQIYLNLPLKPVCRGDCKGLCPQCGANRNTVECGCSGESIDPRLAPLLEFKKRR
jgi:uncharacterized protein